MRSLLVQAEGLVTALLKCAEQSNVIMTTPAKLKTVLLPHQQRVVDRMKKQEGLVVAHGLGSGKTLSSIAAGVNLKSNSIQVLVPAALKDNYLKELKTHVKGELPVEIGSLQNAASKGGVPRADLLIVDEAHRARNPKSSTYAVIRDAEAEKRLLLTASPAYNKPEDVASLVNLAASRKVLPEGRDFERRYVQKPGEGFWSILPFVDSKAKIVRKGELAPVLSNWIDVHKSTGEDYPERIDERIAVPMSKRQTQLHQAAWGQLPFMMQMRMRKGLPPRKKDLSELNKFESQARQISNSESPFSLENTEPVPKLQEAVRRFSQQAESNPKHKALVYSNFLSSVNEYGKLLDERGIPYAKFTGDETRKERSSAVSQYNAGKIKALLVSSAGGEGLDLKGTRQVQVLEPHWNNEKVNQVVGRAIRHRSHADLPPDQRRVVVERYETYPTGVFGGKKTGVEQYLNDLSDQKERLNADLMQLVKQPG